MTRPGNYASPIAFQAAIEDRIRRVVRETGRSHHSIRQRLLFERVLERVHVALNDSFILKGGLALELRIDEARTTRDVDLRAEGELPVALAKIRALTRPRQNDNSRLKDHVDVALLLEFHIDQDALSTRLRRG